jgi:ATP-binding cassette subfamily F protein 3
MIAISGLNKQYGTKVLYKNASLQIKPSEKIGLVGANGAGKTSIFRIIVGEEGYDSGTVNKPDSWVVGYFSQDVGEMKGRSALEEVMAGAGRVSVLAEELHHIEKRLGELAEDPGDGSEMEKILERFGEVQLEFESRGGYDLEARAKEILTGLGISPEDHGKRVEAFSGGWKMRIALAKILVLQPDVLLADEPTNHLDLESIVWLEEWLRNYKGALLMTSHDREFMNRIVSRIVEVSQQTINSYSGNYDFYEREREIRMDQLLAAAKKQSDMLAKEEEFIARFAARASHAAQVQSRVKKLEKIDRIEIPAEEKAIQFEFPVPPRGGNDVVKFASLGKIWTREDGSEKIVFSNASGLVKRQDKVAVIGVNGAGKSTFLKMIAGSAEPTSGNLNLGAGIAVGYFSQHSLEVLNPQKTIFDEIHDRIPEATIGFVRNLLGAFLFGGDDVHKKIGVLSGGEKSRVVLATLLAKPHNLLILDEPTNHLDIRSREMLLEALKKFDGTVMLVSHDRHFLKQLASRVFELDKGEMRIYEGSYKDYLDR